MIRKQALSHLRISQKYTEILGVRFSNFLMKSIEFKPPMTNMEWFSQNRFYSDEENAHLLNFLRCIDNVSFFQKF